MWDKGYTLPELGVHAIFVHSFSIDSTMMARTNREGVKVYAEFATLIGKTSVLKGVYHTRF
ncbi:MAG TPA: hypothetical protein PKM34_00050 [Bacteroidales bacterium]|nr:hypothetical protein [Bacteroidales bacterium]